MNRFLSLILCCIAPAAAAQSLITVGPAAYTCKSHDAVLDGSQLAGTLLMRYDAGSATLRVRVSNTSTASAVPEIRQALFTAPTGTVTRATLIGQDPVGRFRLTFEKGPHGSHNRLDCFGSFMFKLETDKNGITTVPVEFTLKLEGPSVHLLDSASFATAPSLGGGTAVNAALRFEAKEHPTIANSTPAITAPAGCEIYNGNNINLVEFTCVTLPVIGSVWRLDTAPKSSTELTIVGLSLAPTAPVPLYGGELLIDLGTLVTYVGPGVYDLGVPYLPGLPLFLQAARIDAGAIVMLNAIHATLGY